MDIKKFENLIVNEMDKVILKIINDFQELNISAKARAGAEISDFLEDKFVKYTKNDKFFTKSEKSPRGATKNPWDAKTVFCLNNFQEIIWIDFKALKTSGKDSNPDIGTPNKIVSFIKEGNFYLLYIYVFYEETKKGLKFVKINGEYTKSYFLKDINHTFRRNPKNQLQVNMSELPKYRSREDFIKLLVNKIRESHERQIKISGKALKNLSQEESILLKKNKESEAKILENLK
ncbi:hypothetical protein A2Y83_03700 [Candidatus Falkowbacteria bacterium RBG_13_39_14]|uniref:Restriction endonuclease n=1 Tax=Candidatus Falkowbacteria bacterium RBG_13_39_14 TaxID=1797985 RepID=A0A1F5S1R9_9BACT|nr:MAG: hypothetical protein A2Y83_03700 [Candidatus Falkowbacteria bacterium RBG_13_39_14]